MSVCVRERDGGHRRHGGTTHVFQFVLYTCDRHFGFGENLEHEHTLHGGAELCDDVCAAQSVPGEPRVPPRLCATETS